MQVSQFPEQQSLDRLRNIVADPSVEIEWPNVIATVSTYEHEKSIGESSFSVLTNTRGKVKLRQRRKDITLCEQSVYLSNPFESFGYRIQSETPVDTFNIHFNYNFFCQALHTMTNSHEDLLDHPIESDTPYRFTDQLLFKDKGMRHILASHAHLPEEEFLWNFLAHCLVLDQREKGRLRCIPTARTATQKELGKRMVIAKDYIYGHHSDPELSIKALSSLVGMSHFHFIRTFKTVYGSTPYQYIKTIRLERAAHLLRSTDMAIQEIALAVGFKEATALFPVFKKMYDQSPKDYRGKIRNFQ